MVNVINSCNHLLRPKIKNVLRLYSSAPVIKTALYDFHLSHNGKMVDFGGYLLPVLYTGESITSSHLHTRKHCSIFDVSHMLQTKIHGKDRYEFIERLTTADATSLPLNKSALTVFTHPSNGGILDDLIVTNASEGYIYVVSNAGRRDHDSQLMLQTQEIMVAEKKDVGLELLETSEMSLLAVQGPEAALALQPLCEAPLKMLSFMNSVVTTVGGIPNCRISRCGYTGEDGFEVSVPSKVVASLAERLLTSKSAAVKLAGLGARDSLRLEAGLCLYGSDVDETITPIEASLEWLIPKKRRERRDFPGANLILKQLKEGVNQKRVGLKFEGGPPARHDCGILYLGEKVGKVTSGGPSPSLGYPIAMGYLKSSLCKIGTKVDVNIRGKINTATVVRLPFLPNKYYTV